MPLTLYPKQLNLAGGVIIGAGIVWLGQHWIGAVADGGDALVHWGVGLAAIGFGAWHGVRSALGLIRPRPSFAADAEGFSVMGKRKRPWSEFQDIGITKMTYGGITVGKSVFVKVGKGPMLARKQYINWVAQSGSANVMAAQIGAYAQEQAVAMRAREMMADPAPAPDVNAVAERVRPEPAASASRKAAPVGAGFETGPIQSTRGRGLFGG